VHAAFAAGGIDRYYALMMQVGGRLGLVLETLELLGVKRRGKGQDLQRYAAAQRDLSCFIHDSHATPAAFADKTVISDLTKRGRLAVGDWPYGRSAVAK